MSNIEVIGEFIGVNFINDVKYQLTKAALRWRLETAEGHHVTIGDHKAKGRDCVWNCLEKTMGQVSINVR